MTLDLNTTFGLLSIIEKAVAHGNNFSNIIAEANAQLLEINEVARQDSLGRAKAKADAETQAETDDDQSVEDDSQEEPSDDGEPGPSATMTTSPGRRL